MRISDWSSDVCSSDLANRLVTRDLADELGIPVGNAVDFWTEAALFSAAGYTAFVYGPGDIAQAPIGRASCRESVCQYVSISVVAGSSKKKHYTIHTNTTYTENINTLTTINTTN